MIRKDMGKIPHLFAWGDDGLPAEFKVFLKLIGGDEGASLSDFMHNGVVQLAAKYRIWSPKLSHEIRSIIYLLHAYCSRCNAPAPDELLCLTFEALDLRPGRPALESNRLANFEQSWVGAGGATPIAINKLSAFIKASALDGEADARGEKFAVARIARIAGIRGL